MAFLLSSLIERDVASGLFFLEESVPITSSEKGVISVPLSSSERGVASALFTYSERGLASVPITSSKDVWNLCLFFIVKETWPLYSLLMVKLLNYIECKRCGLCTPYL